MQGLKEDIKDTFSHSQDQTYAHPGSQHPSGTGFAPIGGGASNTSGLSGDSSYGSGNTGYGSSNTGYGSGNTGYGSGNSNTGYGSGNNTGDVSYNNTSDPYGSSGNTTGFINTGSMGSGEPYGSSGNTTSVTNMGNIGSAAAASDYGNQDRFSAPSSRSALGGSDSGITGSAPHQASNTSGQRFPGSMNTRNEEYTSSAQTGTNYNDPSNSISSGPHTAAGYQSAGAATAGVGGAVLSNTSGSGTSANSASQSLGQGSYGSYGYSGTGDNSNSATDRAADRLNSFGTDNNTASSPAGTGADNFAATGGTGNQRIDNTISQKLDENTDRDGFTNLSGDKQAGPFTGRVKNDPNSSDSPVVETTKQRSERDEQGRELDSYGKPYTFES